MRPKKFCSFCAGLLVLYETGPHVWCTQCRTVHYANPGPAAVALVPVFREGPEDVGLLGITRADPDEPGYGLLALPAGWQHSGERSQDAAARELFEEVRVRFDPDDLVLFGSAYAHEPNVQMTFWLTPPVRLDVVRSAFVPNKEASEFHHWRNMPSGGIAFSTHHAMIAQFFSYSFEDLRRVRALMGKRAT